MNYLLIFILFCASSTHAFFKYDRAILHGQKNNWTESTNLLKRALIEHPDNPELLYDLGVSSYKNRDHEHALSYFSKAAQSSQASTQLQEQALFNAGNTHAALKQLPEALKAFEEVLVRNPHNSKAAHNKDIVKKMLEEQKQQEQNQDKKNNDDKKDNKQEPQEKDQSDKDPEKKKQNKQNNNEQKDNQKSEPETKNEQSQDQKKSDEQQKNDAQEKEQREQEKQQSNKQNKDTKDQQQKTKKDTGGATDASAEQQKETADQHLTPAMAGMLDEREKKDAQLNKQLMRAMAGSRGGADHDEHYW